MRYIICTAALLLGACVDHPARASDATFTIKVADVATDTIPGRSELRRRVVVAIGQFCSAHAAEVTPHEYREDPRYCPDLMRSAAMAEMSPDVRRAYERARQEAKVQGSLP